MFLKVFSGACLTKIQANYDRPDNRRARSTLNFETSVIVKVANCESISTRRVVAAAKLPLNMNHKRSIKIIIC